MAGEAFIRKRWQDILRTDARFVKMQKIGEQFSASVPAPFVGRFGYPSVSCGLLCPPESGKETWKYDAPTYWASKHLGIPNIISYRGALLNTSRKCSVHEPPAYAKLAALSTQPVDVEIALTKKPTWNLESDAVSSPTGPRAQLRRIAVTANPKIPQKVERITEDELLATEMMDLIHQKGYNENYLSRLLSVGLLGSNKRMVPTRWSITATDDILGKQAIRSIQDYTSTDHALYYGSYLGNHYLIMLLPDRFQFELFETMLPVKERMEVSTDHESYNGRSAYAAHCVGGYYTVRLAVAQKLAALKRQATVIVMRFVTEEYDTPLGVWVTREAARIALERGEHFGSKEALLSRARHLVISNHRVDISPLLDASKLLRERQVMLSTY